VLTWQMVPAANVIISRHPKKETVRVGCGPFHDLSDFWAE